MNSIQRIRRIPAADGVAGSDGRTPRDEVNRRTLLRALQKRGLKETAEKAFWWWPSLECTCLALMDHLGSNVLDEKGSPLAITAISDAFIDFASGVREKKTIEVNVQSFLCKLLDISEYLMSSSLFVVDSNGLQHVWRPFADRYDDWRDRHAGLGEIKKQPKAYLFEDELDAARRMLATITMDTQDFALAFRGRPK